MEITNETKRFIAAVFTMGDNGGYRIYEWFKLFPDERELAEREYIYLKAHLARQAYVEAGKTISKEMWNAFYFALGEAFAEEKVNYRCNYDELCQVLSYYEGASITQLPALFGKRSGVGASVFSQQFVHELPDLISRCRSDLWKKFKA